MSEAQETPTEPATPTAAAARIAGRLPPGVGAAAAEAAAELPRRAADVVQLVVDTIHDKAVRPVVLVTRALVFGLLVAALGTVLVVVGSIALLRIFDVYVFGRQVWLSYIVLGGALTLAGLAAWTRRTAPARAR
ncbi:MAG: hypothetical protein M0010_04510 [Actinomycetota bacterium]|nr:hypothetical protein [Actinomycetota bacterium]